MERRYCDLRKRLDQFGYQHPFDISSLNMVEKLLADVLVTSDQLKNLKAHKDVCGHRACEQHPADHCNHSGCLKVVKENNELHQRLIRSKEEWEKDVKTLNAQLRKLDSENTDLQFLNSQYLQKMEQRGQKPDQPSKKQSQIKKPVTVHRQRVDSTLQGSSSQSTGVQSDRLAGLKVELNDVRSTLEQLDDIADSLKKQVTTRDTEIGRLTRLIESKPPCDCTGRSMPTCSDHVAAHLNGEMQYLQRLNQDLEKRLKEALNCGREAQAKIASLGAQCLQLQERLAEKERLATALNKQRHNLVTTADQEMSEAKHEFEELYAKLDAAEVQLAKANEEKRELLGEKEGLSAQLARMRSTADEAELERRQLSEKLVRAAAAESRLQETVRSMEEEASTSAKRGSPDDHQVTKVVERQRDIYREQVMRLSRIVEESGEDENAAQAHSTPRPKRAGSPTAASFQNEKLVRLLEDERDYYKTQWQRACDDSGAAAPSSSQDSAEVARLTKKLLMVQEEKDELNRTMESLERHVSDTNTALQEALQDKNKLQTLHDKTLASWESQKQKFEKTASPKTRLPLGVFELQRNYEKLVMDLDQSKTIVEDLRSRLRLATETQITERKRLEQRIAELETEVRAGCAERVELVTQSSTGKARLGSSEEQNVALQAQLREMQTTLQHEKRAVERFRTQAETNESALREAQRLISQKVAERGQLERRIQDADSRIESLCRQIESHKEEVAAIRDSNRALDQEKDRIQTQADDKTERIAALQKEVASRERDVDSGWSKIASLESRLDRLTVELLAREGDCKEWKRKADKLNDEVEKAVRYHSVLEAQNQLLEDSVATLTTDNQAMDRELHFINEERDRLRRQVHDYIADVSRVEEMLHCKEMERNELLHQFHELSSTHLHVESEKVQLETRQSDSRMELAAKDSKLRSAQDVVDGLTREVREYQSRQNEQELQVQNLHREVRELECRLSECQRERDALQRDVLATRELCVNLDSKKDHVSERLSTKGKEVQQLEASILAMQHELDSLRLQIVSERSSNENLEHLLNSQRQKEFLFDLNNHELTEEVSQLKDRCRRTESRLEEQTELAGRYRDRVNDLEIELDSIKRQLTNERFEKERLNQEIRRGTRQSSHVTGGPPRDDARHSPKNNAQQTTTHVTDQIRSESLEYTSVYTTEKGATPAVKVTPPPTDNLPKDHRRQGPTSSSC